ncbi:MAG TPA: HAMP domain-containing sensor histidine kinase, partial [Leifsonia sp.]|nr:HAMP domain-containing sensor histidine kinase [Leifsonia sp.]
GARNNGCMASRKSRRVSDDAPWRAVFSVRARIVVAIVLTAGVGLGVAGVATYFVQRQQALARVDSDLVRNLGEVKAVAAAAPTAGQDGVDALLRTLIQQVVPAPAESALGVVAGQAAYVPGGRQPFRMDRDPDLVARFVREADPVHVVMGTAKSDQGTIRYAIVPVTVKGDPAQGLYVAGYNLDTVLTGVASPFGTYAVVAACALALIGLVAWFVAGRLLRPVRDLREAADHLSATRLRQHIPVRGNDDLSLLAAGFNRMSDRMEESFTAQRRLLDDVGHELKTPITIVRGHLELLDPTDPVDVGNVRELAVDELDRMSELVGEITLLAESRGPGFVDAAPADLADLTRAVSAKAAALAPDRPWVTELVAEGDGLLDVRRITQAWLQLAENAAKYSTPGGVIALGSERVHGRTGMLFRAWVRDDGPGIGVADQARIFERFQRGGTTRGVSGSGLGLAIVTAIAHAHGGSVDVTSSPAGSTFMLSIPCEHTRGTSATADQRSEPEEQGS